MLHLLASTNSKVLSNRVYVYANTDKLSLAKVKDFEGHRCFGKAKYFSIPRSREVKQSFITSILTTLYSFIFAFFLVLREKPDIIICNGPGTCLPICYCAFIFNVWGAKFHFHICKIYHLQCNYNLSILIHSELTFHILRKILLRRSSKIIYVESIARVKSLSLTAKLIKPMYIFSFFLLYSHTTCHFHF